MKRAILWLSVLAGCAETAGALPSEEALVMPNQSGLDLVSLDGTIAWSSSWEELIGCSSCGGEGANPDGDGLLVAFTEGGGPGQGGVARLGAEMELDGEVGDLGFPHAAVRDPSDGSWVVAETTAGRLVWLDEVTQSEIRSLSSSVSSDFDMATPNGLHLLSHDGGSYLLVSSRGEGGQGQGGASGSIALWDITDPDAPSRVWRFPEQGSLHTPHGPILREVDGQYWLLYAHTYGSGDGSGTVGVASLADPLSQPQYVADLVPDGFSLSFFRGIEIVDGTLYLTDSGAEQGASGMLLAAPAPGLEPSGSSGAFGDEQELVSLSGVELLLDGLESPFEGWLRSAQ